MKRKREGTLSCVHVPDRSLEQLLCQREEHLRPDDPRDRTRTVHLRVALAHEPLPRVRIRVERDPAVPEALRDVREAKIDDLEYGRLRELVEHEHRVETVQQFRREVLSRALENLVARLRRDDAVVVRRGLVREDVRADVAREADDGILQKI